jgi:alkyl hydroperoxide reductase subunit AhpC
MRHDTIWKIKINKTAISTDSEYSHYAWAEQPRNAGGLGPNLRIPLLADRNMSVARDYGCLIEDKGIALRASYLIDPKGVLRQITMNDLPVGRSVDEALRLVQAFQFTVSFLVFFFFFWMLSLGQSVMSY